MPSRGWNGAARYGLAGLVLGVALTGGLGIGRGTATSVRAETAPGADRSRLATGAAGEASGTLAFTSSTAGSAQLLYLIDTKTKAFTIYRVDPAGAEGTVRLIGARQYQWDMKLSSYNNQPPEVSAIESTVKTAGHTSR